MNDEFLSMAAALRKNGLEVVKHRAGRLMVSTQTGPVRPDRGNSFWLAHSGGDWFVATWAPACYRFEDPAVVAAFCLDFARSGDEAAITVPDEMTEMYRLSQRLTPAEYDALLRTLDQEGA